MNLIVQFSLINKRLKRDKRDRDPLYKWNKEI